MIRRIKKRIKKFKRMNNKMRKTIEKKRFHEKGKITKKTKFQ